MKYNKSVTKLVLFGIVVVIDFRGGKHCYRCCDAYNIQPRIVLSNKNSNVIINDHHVVASWLTCIPSSSSYVSRRLQMSPSPYSDEGGYGGSTTENEWSTTDDWNRLSDENPQNSAVDSRTLLDQDIIRTVANLLADESIGLNKKPKSSEEKWVDDTISHIYHVEESCCKNDLIISDDESETIFENNDEDLEFEEDMSREIAMLVRCNESPETMLIEQGRAIPELTPEQLNDVSQLIQSDDSNHIEENQPHQWIATTFLQQAVHFMFEQHGSTMQINGDPETTKIMDAVGIASWMQTSLKEAADATTTTKYEAKQRQQLIGRHDSRVVETIAKYGSYGKNYLTEPEFVQFYVSAIVGTSDSNHRHLSTMEQVQKYRQEEIKNVWRDIRNHGIVSPIELQRTMQLAELKEKLGLSLNDGDTSLKNSLMILDECELVYDDQINNGGTSRTSDRQGRSSHELVQTVSPTSKVPLYMKDGDFVFIDEETCIGCMQVSSI